MMTDVDMQLKAIDALVHMHSNVKNDQRYPSFNQAIIHLIETLYLHIVETLKHESPSAFAQLETKNIADQNISGQKDDKTIPVLSLLDILHVLDFKSFTFDKDLEKEEVKILMNFVAKKPIPAQGKAQQSAIMEVEEVETVAQVHSDDKVVREIEMPRDITDGQESPEEQFYKNIAEAEKVFTRLKAMNGAIESIPSAEKKEMISNLSVQAAQWLETETTFTPEFKETCLRLQKLLQDFIQNGFIAEANPIVNVFSRINEGKLIKDDKIRVLSLEIIKNLASDSNFNVLFKEINTNEKNKKYEALKLFAGFGDVVLKKLLSVLKNADDSKVRINILHTIEAMGSAAIPTIKSSINMYEPWYYLRNLAYILGRIGNDTSVEILKPLLLHKEKRVRMEAFKSINQTGGDQRGPLLLSVLPEVDQNLRVNIIEILGKVKCKEAVTDLHDMLKSKSSMPKEDLISMQEKICKALASIGSPEAIKTLSEIVESKSILGIGAYPKEVKYAAERALEFIRRR
jgi:HEAT repeat protein